MSLPAVRAMGVEAAARKAVARLSGDELDGFFIHFDADVLDDAIMPAVEYRIPGGLSWDEMKSVLGIALATGRAVGLEVTIYNPEPRQGWCGRDADWRTRFAAARSARRRRAERRHSDSV